MESVLRSSGQDSPLLASTTTSVACRTRADLLREMSRWGRRRGGPEDPFGVPLDVRRSLVHSLRPRRRALTLLVVMHVIDSRRDNCREHLVRCGSQNGKLEYPSFCLRASAGSAASGPGRR